VKFWKTAPCDDAETPLRAVALNNLKLSHINRAIASRPRLSGKTINNYVSVLREAIQLAVSDEILKTNPAADKSLRAAHQNPPPDPFSLAEAEMIIAHAHKHYPADVANLIEAWFFSGYRTSEVFGLRWSSVDWNLRQVQVHEALVRGRENDKTKTGVVRNIAMNTRSESALRRQKQHTFMAGELVFMDSRYGEPWNEERAFRRSYWTPALKACGIRYRRPYNMRHTFATMLLMSGATPAYAAKQMGHSVEQFLHTYAKWLDDGHQALEQQRLERFIGGAGSVPESFPEMKTGT
jgi:integrase